MNNNPYVAPITTTLNDGLFAVYKGENNALDSLGNYNGTAQGGLTYASGVSGNAFQFNGTTAYIKQNTDDSWNGIGNSFSIKFDWYAKSGNDQGLLSNLKLSGSNIYGWVIYYNASYLSIEFYNGGTSSVSTYRISDTNFSLNSWNKIIFVHNYNTSNKIYVNAVEVTGSYTVGDGTQNPTYTTGHQADIGAYYYGTHQGFVKNATIIDEVNLYSRVLSTDEVTELQTKFYPF
jgi:hypothetical protein